MDLGDPTLKPIKVMGVGTFGRVFLCKYHGNRNVCVKRIIVKNPKTDMSLIMEEVSHKKCFTQIDLNSLKDFNNFRYIYFPKFTIQT